MSCEPAPARHEHLDAYLLHWPDESVPLEEPGAPCTTSPTRASCAQSASPTTTCRHRAVPSERTVDLVPDGLSLIDHLDARERFARCDELRIPWSCRAARRASVLSRRTVAEVREIRKDWSEFGFSERLLAAGRAERRSERPVLEAMRPIAAQHAGVRPQLALAWVLHQPGVPGR